MRSSTWALVALIGMCDSQTDQGTRSPGQLVVTEALPCLTMDSLSSDRLWYTDAIVGMRGTSGGTRLTMSPRGNDWLASLEPIWSDFPEEPNDDIWPRNAPSLTLSWEESRDRVRFRRIDKPTGMDANGRPYDTVLAEPWPDSMTATVRCDEVVLLRWDGGRADTLRLERRGGAGS
jgi:hypothetical protein